MKKTPDTQQGEPTPERIAELLVKVPRTLSDSNRLITLKLQQLCEEIRTALQSILETFHKPFNPKYPPPERTLEILTTETPKIAAQRSLNEAKVSIGPKKSHPCRIYTVKDPGKNRFLINARDIVEGSFDNIVDAYIFDSRPDDHTMYKKLRLQETPTADSDAEQKFLNEPAIQIALLFRAELKARIQQTLEEAGREKRRIRKTKITPPSPHP